MQVTFFKVRNASEEIKQELFNEIIKFVDVENFENDHVVEDFGYDGNNETGVMFTFLPADQTEKLIEVLTKFDLLISSNDVTTAVLMGDFQTNPHWLSLFGEDTIANFNNILTDFLESNLTKDLVLDKMNEKGFDSLTKTDLKVLNA